MSDELRDQAIDVFTDNIEALVDQLIKDDLLKGLPLLGTAVGVARIGITVRDRLFLAKVSKFLFAPTKVADEDRQKFYEQLGADEKLRRKTAEVVVLLLDRCDDLDKPEMLAKIFAAFMKGKIDFNQFRRLSSAIDLAFIEDLKGMVALGGSISEESKSALLRTGLTEISQFETAQKTMFSEQQFVMRGINITSLGTTFIGIMQDEMDRQEVG